MKTYNKKIADDTNTNTIGVKEQGLGTSIINFSPKRGRAPKSNGGNGVVEGGS